jgi:hypothetical protein
VAFAGCRARGSLAAFRVCPARVTFIGIVPTNVTLTRARPSLGSPLSSME